MKRALLALALLALMTKPAGATTGMVLTYQYRSFPTPPSYCYHEDTIDQRSYSGTLGPGESFSVPNTFCSLADWPQEGGNMGLYYSVVYSRGQSVELKVTLPDGTIRQAHPLAGYYEFTGCVMPYGADDGRVFDSLTGTYTVTLTNTGTKAISTRNPLSEAVWVIPGDITTQREFCPPEDQNTGPAP